MNENVRYQEEFIVILKISNFFMLGFSLVKSKISRAMEMLKFKEFFFSVVVSNKGLLEWLILGC